MLVSQLDGFVVTACQGFTFPMIAMAKNQSDCMDYMFRSEVSAGCDNGVSRCEPPDLAHDLAAFREDGWTSGAMDGAVDSSSAKQGRIGSVDDRVGGFLRNVGWSNDLDDLAFLQQQSHRRDSRTVLSDDWVPVLRYRVLIFYFLSVSASTPGNLRPSRNSSDAPPPVEMWVILSATFAAFTAATESPPPTIEIAPPLSATA